MHALMTENDDGTMLIEIVGRDPGTDTEIVVERIDGEIKSSSREVMYPQANKALIAHNYRPMGTWRNRNHDGVHRIIVERQAPTVESSDADEETSSGFTDSYRSRKVKGVVEESWYREEGGVESALKVVKRGRWGTELDQRVRSGFGSDALPFDVQTTVLLSIPDIRKLIATLTRICDDAEKEN